MKLKEKIKSLKLFWKIYFVWLILVLIGTTGVMIFGNIYDKKTEEIQTQLNSIYKRLMPAFSASSQSRSDAYLFPNNKQELIKKYGLSESTFFFLDRIAEDKERIQSVSGTFGLMELVLIPLGFIFFIFYLLLIIYKLARRKLINKKETFLRFGAVGVILISVIIIFSVESKKHTKKIYSQVNTAYDLSDYYTKSFGGLTDLSNEIYELYKIENMPGDYSGKFFVQLEYIKKKTDTLIKELEKIHSQKTIQPAIDICRGIASFIDLYTANYKSPAEKLRNEAKAIAEFRVVLDKLDEYLPEVVREYGLFSKYTMLSFSPEAVKEYDKIRSDAENKEYSVFLIFGYRIYDKVISNLEKEE